MNHHAGQIGGSGTTVEIDESKFGKMKYYHSRYIEGQWVFGSICREMKVCFLVPVERRDKDTLLPIICTHILPRTRVTSDTTKAYDCLQDEGYSHITVNHSLNFVDPDTGASSEQTPPPHSHTHTLPPPSRECMAAKRKSVPEAELENEERAEIIHQVAEEIAASLAAMEVEEQAVSEVESCLTYKKITLCSMNSVQSLHCQI
ncbi:hypothetical protein ACROYT_G015413 [Oculina patagonica]